MSEKIKLFWWRPLRYRPILKLRLFNRTLFKFPPAIPFDNFGDALSPLIVSALSGLNPQRVTKNYRGKLIAIGSLLYAARAGDNVWGTGAWGNETISSLDGISFLAVRGPLTRKKILERAGTCPEVYGDPAMLCPYLFKAPSVQRTGVAIFPHFYNYSLVYKTIKDSSVTILNPMENPLTTIDRMTRCALVISSSLHGIITAEAYGIPSIWVKISNRIEGGDRKYHDYYMSTAREGTFCDWRSGIDLAAAVKMAEKFTLPKIDLKPLLNSFPYLHPSKRDLIR